MKTTQISIGVFGLLLILFFWYDNVTLKKEVLKLQDEMAHLNSSHFCIKKCKKEKPKEANQLSDHYLYEFDTIYKYNKIDGKYVFSGPIEEFDAIEHTTEFRHATSLFIPASWEFRKRDLLWVLGMDTSNVTEDNNGIRFYASVNPTDTLRLVGVQYKLNANNQRNDYALNKLINFSRICPTECNYENSPLRDLNFEGLRIGE